MTNIENAEKSIEKVLKNFSEELKSKVNSYLSIQNENNNNNNNKISIQIKSEPIDFDFDSNQIGINPLWSLCLTQETSSKIESKLVTFELRAR